MSRRLTHISLVLVLLLSSEVWAVGLGDIRLQSALNEPLRAEITLLSATPDEVSNLKVALASADTFERYGIDRPFYLQDIQFNLVNGPNGSIVQLRSRQPMTEPFLTFLVEASWPSGRLLREYTVLLDPPTFAPPAAQQAPAVTAPTRSVPADSGRIERAAPAPRSQPSTSAPPQRASAPRSQPSTSAPVDDSPYDSSAGGDYVVQRSETLWGIASRVRPDARLTMNQTMLAIFEANRDAFGGNINVLRAGAALRIPSADEIVRISSGVAFEEVKRQNEAWSGGSGYTAPPAEETRPSLVLVPPDEEPEGLVYDDDLVTSDTQAREEDLEQRIYELETTDVPDQPSLIAIRDTELAELRQELAELRGEVYEPPADVDEDPFVDDEMEADAEMDDEIGIDDLMADDELADDAEIADDEAATAADDAQAEPVATRPAPEPSLLDRILGALTSVWAAIGAALLVVVGLLVWFMSRGGDDDADSAPWESLDSDEMGADTLASTESMAAPTADEAFVVVEQDSGIRAMDETAEIAVDDGLTDGSGEFGSLEDTFSSETAVNLDQTDPIAEADFHMAYGLYDQAADLINGALETSPNDTALMSKLCEIYFVWGNRDAFVDAAGKLKSAGGEGADWDKIVIMGQQIAADDALFAGAGVAGATKAVDLAFEADGDGAGELDMDFGGEATADAGSDSDDGVDFFFEEDAGGDEAEDALDLEITAQSPTMEITGTEKTLEMPESPAIDLESTAETPTIEQPVDVPSIAETDATSELPSLDDTLGQALSDTGQDASATAEINLDDLDLGIDDLAETELASLDDLDATGTNEALTDVFDDTGSVTGKNPEIDPTATGVREGLDLGELFDLDATGEMMNLASDETGRSPLLDVSEDDATAETEVSIDESLLDATGLTQVLSDDMAVETGTDVAGVLGDDDATMLASMDEEDDDFDFAKTEALPADAFPAQDADATGEMPAMTGAEDLDLDDLTAALKLSEGGDTVEQLRDDATVEQPRPSISGQTAEVPTMSLGPEDMSDDLHEARTMTEVGTKLDLARAYVDMGDPAGARSILEEVLDEGDDGQRQQAQQLLDSLPS
ncbi:MAG: FimV/HubP family polar landmark protein [Woeseiaceae bacterium]